MTARPCPICKTPTALDAPHRPFCCARCKQIDLGNWLGEAYRVSRPMMPWDVEAAHDIEEEEDDPQYLH